MKSFYALILIAILFNSISGQDNPQAIVQKQVKFTPNRLSTTLSNTGIFNQNIDQNNSPSFNWPAGSNKFAWFTAGLTICARVNGNVRMAAASYEGEYAPGYILGDSVITNNDFRLYRISKFESPISNPDYENYYKMIPFGAPYDDVNNNGVFDIGIDEPGVKGANETVFICLTDGFIDQHNSSEGFGGGTLPLGAEVHVTFWGYNTSLTKDVHFMRYQIINKSNYDWDSTRIGFFADPDLGDATDDRLGCDTSLNMGYIYNSSNEDGKEPWGYGLNPPAAGIKLLRVNHLDYFNYQLTSFISISRTSSPGPLCEREPNDPKEAYNLMKGLKTDETNWINPLTSEITKYCYSGDPETLNGWTEFDGGIDNCGGSLTGNLIPKPGGDRKFIASLGSDSFKVKPGDTRTIFAAQMIARGADYLNSVTRLKDLAKRTDILFNECYLETLTNINPIIPSIPQSYTLFQNYPNPFNPTTTIKFEIPEFSAEFEANTKLSVFDISGREVVTFINEKLQPGTYEYTFDGTRLSSGVYFYKIQSGGFVETKKMVLVK
jgi:hypothetical protein